MSNQLSAFYASLAAYWVSAAFFFFCKPKRGRIILSLLWLLHSSFLIQRYMQAKHLPLSGLFEPLNFFAWCILGILVINFDKLKTIVPGLCVAGLLLLCAAAAPKNIRALPAALDTIWFELHVASAFISYACFAVAACASTEKWGLKISGWGLFIFTFSMVTGGIWAYLAWMDYWVWTPKELWSVLIWLYYATVLHAAKLPTWRKHVSKLLILGFLLLMFTYLGVGLLMKSSHPL